MVVEKVFLGVRLPKGQVLSYTGPASSWESSLMAIFKHLKLLFKAFRNWSADNAFQHSAALAFYTIFSMAPLLILAVTFTGIFFGEDAAQGELVDTLTQWIGAEAAAELEKQIVLANPRNSGWFSTVLGFTLLGIGATTVFGQLQLSLNQIWKVTTNPQRNTILVLLKTRLMSLTLVLTIGFLLLVSLFFTAFLSTVIAHASDYVRLPGWSLKTVDSILSLIIITGLFASIFKVLPDVILPWKEALIGAFITALLFILGKYLISIYLAYSGATSAYGAAGSLVAILLWVNYSGLILFLGVQVTKVYAEDWGTPVLPKSTAVALKIEMISPTEPEMEGPTSAEVAEQDSRD